MYSRTQATSAALSLSSGSTSITSPEALILTFARKDVGRLRFRSDAACEILGIKCGTGPTFQPGDEKVCDVPSLNCALTYVILARTGQLLVLIPSFTPPTITNDRGGTGCSHCETPGTSLMATAPP